MSIGANRTPGIRTILVKPINPKEEIQILKALSGKRSSCFSIGENAKKAAERSAEAIKKQFGRRKQWQHVTMKKDGAKTRDGKK